MHRSHFLLSFIGLALFAIFLFGMLAYQIADETAEKRVQAILHILADREAQIIADRIGENDLHEISLSDYSIENIKIVAVLLSDAGNVIWTSNKGFSVRWQISKLQLSQLYAAKSESGLLIKSKKKIHWVRHKVKNYPYTLLLFSEVSDENESPLANLASRLIITGIIIVWIAVWMGLIIFGIIAKKTGKIERERRESDEQVRLLLNSTAEGIFGIDTDGNCTFCNPSALLMLGYNNDSDMLGKNMHHLIHHTRSDGSRFPVDECSMEKIITFGDGIHIVDELFWRADGAAIPVEYRGYPIYRDKKVTGAVITFMDVTEKLKSELETKKLSQVVEQATEGVLITDPAGAIEYLNPAFEHMTGYRNKGTLGKHFTSTNLFKHEVDNPDHFWNKIKDGDIQSNMQILHKANDDEIYVRQTVVPLRDINDNIINIVFTFEDVSTQIEQEEKFQRAIDEKREAEIASKEKGIFLARMSHELRTPLNAIIGYSELLKDEMVERENVNYIADIDKIHAAGSHLFALINDILDFSKIEAGKMEVLVEKLDVQNMINEVIDIVSPIISQNENEFEVICRHPPGEIYSDMLRVRQCLCNLLSNAAKFTFKGSIKLIIERYEKNGEEFISFEVSDTGIGIEANIIGNLFKEFSQADSTTTRRFGGTGLGLSISHHLIGLMGGDIHVKSKINKGSSFKMYLPVSEPEVTKNSVVFDVKKASGE